jgi:hypothetical protein
MRFDSLLGLLHCRKPQRHIPGVVASFVTGASCLIVAAKPAGFTHIRGRRLHLKVSLYGNRLTFGADISWTCCYAADAAVLGCAGQCREMPARQRQTIDRILNARAVFHELGKRHGIERRETDFPYRCIVDFQRHQRSAIGYQPQGAADCAEVGDLAARGIFLGEEDYLYSSAPWRSKCLSLSDDES